METVSSVSGITHFVIHARKAFLKGLNPAANRSVPPLRYDFGEYCSKIISPTIEERLPTS